VPVIGNERVTVLNAPLSKDGYGNQVRDWDAAVATVIGRVTVDPLSGQENTTANDQTTTTMRAIMPANSPVGEFSRIQWLDRTWEVDGRPDIYRGGPLAHLSVVLKEVQG
jgi:head-tail adaptor